MRRHREVESCKYCRLPIRFFRNSRSGRWLTVNAAPVAHSGSPDLVVVVDGNYVICTHQAVLGETVYLPHWLNNRCPNRPPDEKRTGTPETASAPAPA